MRLPYDSFANMHLFSFLQTIIVLNKKSDEVMMGTSQRHSVVLTSSGMSWS